MTAIQLIRNNLIIEKLLDSPLCINTIPEIMPVLTNSSLIKNFDSREMQKKNMRNYLINIGKVEKLETGMKEFPRIWELQIFKKTKAYNFDRRMGNWLIERQVKRIISSSVYIRSGQGTGKEERGKGKEINLCNLLIRIRY